MTRSSELWDRAKAAIPGGVDSPVRAFRNVGRDPIFVAKGAGGTIIDVDGKSYVDLCLSWGALPLGHAHPEIVEAVRRAAGDGMTYGAATEREVELAETIKRAVPSIDKVRLVSSGTEATMSAVRLARGFAGRTHILKFAGGYHGHVDSLLVAAGSAVATGSVPASAGVTAGTAAEVLVAPFNDLERTREVARRAGKDLAAIIAEPIAGNMGLVQPDPGFLPGLRALCDELGALLILDEVITGFRLRWGAIQDEFGVKPDLTTLGKIIGGGLPIGAFGGRADVMARLAPEGNVFQAGTLSGNPVATAAGLAGLRILERDRPYERMAATAARIADGFVAAAKEAGLPCATPHRGSMFTPFLGVEATPHNIDDAKKTDAAKYGALFRAMAERGVYLPPATLEVGFTCAAHTDADVDRVLGAVRESFRAL
ncbi:MAG: glutamate-1-semialdehyde 2,1-aminomutase [Deltaproteobacteria bacterium]|nr:glutamate-1-semialdehyde 2,1-aminomutase [Deltaproteobacteria bacterium]